MTSSPATVDAYQQYIDGRWLDAASGSSYTVANPSTAEIIARVPASAGADVDAAVAAARRSFDAGDWRWLSQGRRSETLLEIGRHLAVVSEGWAALEAANSGAVIRKTSAVDVPMAIEHWGVLAEQARGLAWYEPLPWTDLPYVSWNFVQREPVGVCAGIVPWNYPLMMAVWKIAPALAMGNSVVLKPAPDTPLSALTLVRAIDETGLLPPGVLNVVTGPDRQLGEALVAHPQVDKVAFTGSTATGRRVLAVAASGIKKVTLELGGKSANIVCPDADLDLAVDGALFATFFHQGQMCESGTRLYLHEEIHDDFLDRLVTRARSLVVGDASDWSTQLGPLINRRQYDAVTAAISRAREEGATILCGGGRPDRAPAGGHYIAPTILADVDPNSHAAREEIFGPVVAVQRWRDRHEVIDRANDTMYGLAAGIWSRDTRGAIAMARRLRVGTVWINDWHLINALAPFGGYRQSGLGRELGVAGLREYTEVKHIHVDQGVPRTERFLWDILLG